MHCCVSFLATIGYTYREQQTYSQAKCEQTRRGDVWLSHQTRQQKTPSLFQGTQWDFMCCCVHPKTQDNCGVDRTGNVVGSAPQLVRWERTQAMKRFSVLHQHCWVWAGRLTKTSSCGVGFSLWPHLTPSVTLSHHRTLPPSMNFGSPWPRRECRTLVNFCGVGLTLRTLRSKLVTWNNTTAPKRGKSTLKTFYLTDCSREHKPRQIWITEMKGQKLKTGHFLVETRTVQSNITLHGLTLMSKIWIFLRLQTKQQCWKYCFWTKVVSLWWAFNCKIVPNSFEVHSKTPPQILNWAKPERTLVSSSWAFLTICFM